jgi:GNAT superfamily N-acetyltransferase
MYREDSSHPFRSLALVTQFLENRRNFQIVAEDAGRVVASMAMAYQRWNNSYELGRALTTPEYRRIGLARVLMQQVVDWVGDASFGELTFGYPRVRRIADLGLALGPQMMVVGHDNGRNVAHGTRETHLISCGIPYHASFTHVRPAVDELSGWQFLRNIYSKLRLNGSAGAYPPEYFVCEDFNTLLLIGPWTFAYSAGAPEGSLEIAALDADDSSPEHIAEELGEVLSRLRSVQHITTTVLADKSKMVRALVRQGFHVSAYLPAWYKVGRYRYDCVQLTRRLYTGEPAIHDLGEWLEELDREFQRMPYGSEAV